MDRKALTLLEAAQLAGVSTDTIRRKLKAGEIKRAASNRRGLWIDYESLADAMQLHGKVEQPPALQAPTIDAEALQARITELETALEVREAVTSTLVQELRDQLASMRQEHDRTVASMRTDHQAELDRLHALLTNLTTPRPSLLDRLLSRWK